MIAEIGHYVLLLALATALFQTGAGLIGARGDDAPLIAATAGAARAQFGLILAAFLALTAAYVTSDFSVQNVYQNSHTLKPMIYKLSGVWGNHEGSMVLWLLILTLFGAAVASFGETLRPSFQALVLSVQGAIGAAFLIFVVAASNPFLRLDPAPFEGQGLNPILQDPALAFHPPLLYAGYVGLSIAFSFAVAALIEGKVDAAWARWVRPWTLLAWMFLTLGIAMGSWWAYYELGWGGWWFWDPVENSSLMPWLAATALLHSALVMERRDALKVWTILLAILAFSLSLIGTFLVRSGVLTSVHAFAVDPDRGLFILLILMIFIGGALALYAWRAPTLKQGGLFAPISREGALIVNNLLLTTACAAVFIGTLYPLALEAVTGDKISVGPPFFNATFVPLLLPLLLLVPFGPMLAWKRGDARATAERLFAAGLVAVLGIGIAFWLAGASSALGPFAIGLGLWLVAGALWEPLWRAKAFRAPWTVVRDRLFNLPRSAYGTMFAHAGVGIMVLGIAGVSAWREEAILAMKPGEQADIAGYQVAFDGVAPATGPNYRDEAGQFTVTRGGEPVTALTAARRTYVGGREMNTTEAGIHAAWSGDLYVVLGDRARGEARTVRLYFNPLARLIWIGAFIMFLGGGISLSDRRYRIGAPRRAKQRAKAGAAKA